MLVNLLRNLKGEINMKRYIKASRIPAKNLQRLNQAIEDSKKFDDMFSKCDFRYFVEYDGTPDSYLVWLADYNEYIGASEYYEYSFVSRWFDKFSAAVAHDTGYDDFYFEPYNSVEFCGRVWTD